MRSHSLREMKSRLSQTRSGVCSPAFAGTASALRSSPRIPPPLDSAFARREAKDDADNRMVGSTRGLPVADSGQLRNQTCCQVAWARLSSRALQTERFQRAPSLPDCPCSPSVTRSVLLPRPAARRRSASASPPSGSWFLPEGRPPGMHGLALGSGAHFASLRAGVSRVRSGANPDRRKDHGTL